MPNYCIYKHTFPNGKVYIGITCMDPKKRWSGGSGYNKQPKMANAIRYYGWRNIKHEILFDGLTREEAEVKEIELIAEYDAIQRGYNAEHGGNTTGTHSEETKKKISAGNKGKNTGRKRTEEERQRISASSSGSKNHFYGKHHTEETKAKHSLFMQGNTYAKGYHHTEAFKVMKSHQMHEKYKDGGNPRCREVIRISKGGDEVKYASLRIAARENGLKPSTMSTNINAGKPLGDFYWRFANEQ